MPYSDPFGEYEFVNGEWRYAIGRELMTPAPAAPVAADVKWCLARRKNGKPCGGSPKESGYCAAHERQQ